MLNNYPQIAVAGCRNAKANLYYDIQRQVWIEHLVSSCVDNEQGILDFCKQVYPSLNIDNFVQLDVDLKFSNWCELLPLKTDEIPRCKSSNSIDEIIRSYRCLHRKSQQEDRLIKTSDCNLNRIQHSNNCYRIEKWQELATLNCANKNTILNSTLTPFQSCGLAQFRAVQFICCVLKDNDEKNDYETNLAEGNSIDELLVIPKTSAVQTHRRIIAMSLGSREPIWMTDYQQWNTNDNYFANDEDVNDEQDGIKLSSLNKSHLTINEHQRFTKEKQEFKRKYSTKFNEIKVRWQIRQNQLQQLANDNPNRIQTEYEQSEIEFRQDYEFLKQIAARERARINQLHESNLDSIIDIAKIDTQEKLNSAWKANPLKAENLKETLHNYLHVLLRDRIHLVNRYSRLQVVEPERAQLKRVSIHERLRSIANQINQALNKLRQYPTIQSKIQSDLNALISDYADVNQAAETLLLSYNASLSTTVQPFDRNDKPINAFSNQKYAVNENDYDKNMNEDDDDDDDDYDDDDDQTTTIIIRSTKPTISNKINWQINKDEFDSIRIETINDDLLMNSKQKFNRQQHLIIIYLPYIIGILFVLCLIFGLFIFRTIIQQRRRTQYGNRFEKNYVFTEIDTTTPDDRALHALQANGYENPTYKFFESQTEKC